MGAGNCKATTARYSQIYNRFQKHNLSTKNPDPHNKTYQKLQKPLHKAALAYVACKNQKSENPQNDYRDLYEYYKSGAEISGESHPTVQASRHLLKKRAISLVKSRLKGKSLKEQYSFLRYAINSYRGDSPIRYAAEKLIGPIEAKLAKRQTVEYDNKLKGRTSKNKYLMLSSLLNGAKLSEPKRIAMQRLMGKYRKGAIEEKTKELASKIKRKPRDTKITFLAKILLDSNSPDISREAAKYLLSHTR